jgi:hypothetical protein
MKLACLTPANTHHLQILKPAEKKQKYVSKISA